MDKNQVNRPKKNNHIKITHREEMKDHQDLQDSVDKNQANRPKKNNHIKITHTEEMKDHQDL